MAEVHVGRDARLGRTVAIKLLRSDLARDPTFQARFRREAQSAAGLNHPAIVAVYDTGEEPVVDVAGEFVALPYIVMEYVQGHTLRELLEDARRRVGAQTAGGPHQPAQVAALDVDTALEVTSGVLSALDYSHRMGIVHRDIKPANVMITPVGDVKVMDFGIARAMADASVTMTQTQAVIGTAQYLSPEQARGETVDTRSDLYSTGCLLYELLTGRPPFVADSPVAVAYQHVREYPQPPSTLNPNIPEDVDRVIMHALTKDREERYQTAEDFRADLEAVRSGRAVSAPVAMPPAGEATEYLGATPGGTRTMQAAEPQFGPLGVGGYDDGTGEDRYRDDGQDKTKRNLGYLGLVVSVLAVFALVAWLVSGYISGGDNSATPSGSPVTEMVEVPDVVGLALDVALGQIAGKGLEAVQEARTVTDANQVGLVQEQTPAGRTQARKGEKVTIVVGKSPDSIEVPPLAGLSRDAARQKLSDANLALAGEEPLNENAKKDSVLKSEPASGTAVKPGSKVTLFYASGQVQVPPVLNQNVDDARRTLAASGFDVKTVQQEADQAPNTVVRQDPSGGSLQKVGSTVNLVIAVPKTVTTTTPSSQTTSSTTSTTTTTTTTTTTPTEQGGPPNP
jgi:serine/threonine-protein kinase